MINLSRIPDYAYDNDAYQYHPQVSYAEEIRRFINRYIDALCLGNMELAKRYLALIKRYI